jgi:large subunit ribosomal protein L25
LDVECLPDRIPEVFAIDVSELEIGQSLHVRDIKVLEGVEILNDPDGSIISVVAPAVVEEEAPAEEELEGEGEAEAEGEGEAEAAPEESAEKKSDD